MRDLARSSLAAMRSLRQARQQLSGFLLRHGCHHDRPAWTLMHRLWLAGLRFKQPANYTVLKDCIATIKAATARRDRLTDTGHSRGCTRPDQFVQRSDLDTQVAFLDGQIGPDILQQFRLHHYPARMRMEKGQNVEGPRADHQIRSIDPEPAQFRQKLNIELNRINRWKSEEMDTRTTIEAEGLHAKFHSVSEVYRLTQRISHPLPTQVTKSAFAVGDLRCAPAAKVAFTLFASGEAATTGSARLFHLTSVMCRSAASPNRVSMLGKHFQPGNVVEHG
jgi:hypothetical protein